MEETNYAALSDAEISELLKKNQKTALTGKLVMFAGLAITILAFVTTKMLIAIPGVIMLLAGAFISNKASKKIKEVAGNSILQLALKNVFDDVHYEPFSRISQYDLDSAGFNFCYDEINGSDHVNAKYKGLEIEMSDIELVSVSVDDEGHETRSTVFKGMWLICDFGKELSADVRVMERGKLGKMLGKGGIKTDNEQFNKQFNIKSDNAEEVFYILTPHMMEYIMQMDEKADARTNLSFKQGGKLHVALDSGKDCFEIKGNNSDVAKIREQFIGEIKQVTDLIDELRITDGIFKK